MRNVKFVEALERKYRGKWVRVRGIMLNNILYKNSRLYGKIEGVSVNGYAKVSTQLYTIVKEWDVIFRYKECGEWVEMKFQDVVDAGYEIYRELDVEFMLTGVWGKGLEFGSVSMQHIMGNWETGLMMCYGALVVKTREALEFMMEQDYVNLSENGRGVWIDESVTLKGIKARDFWCIGGSGIYISSEQAGEVDWGDVKERTRWDLVGGVWLKIHVGWGTYYVCDKVKSKVILDRYNGKAYKLTKEEEG